MADLASADQDLTPEAVQRLVGAIGHRLPSIAERTARRAIAEIPGYDVLSEAEVLEGVQRDLALAVQALLEDRPLTDADRATMSTIGDTRAQQGLPLEGMLRVYRVTVDEIFSELWDAVQAEELLTDEVLLWTRKVWSYAGPMMDLATSAYRTREIALALADNDRRTGLVHELLLSSHANAEALLTSLGLDPLQDHVAFRARGGGADLLRALKLPGVLTDGVVVPYEGDLIGLAARRPAVNAGELAGATVGVGPPGGVASLPASFALATRTVDTAAAFGLTGVLTLAELPLHAVARSEGELTDLLRERCIAPVLALGGTAAADVLQTVAAFLDHDRSADATGEALDVHPNTVRNRLHRYEQLTGLSLRAFDDLVQLRLALLRHQLVSG